MHFDVRSVTLGHCDLARLFNGIISYPEYLQHDTNTKPLFSFRRLPLVRLTMSNQENVAIIVLNPHYFKYFIPCSENMAVNVGFAPVYVLSITPPASSCSFLSSRLSHLWDCPIRSSQNFNMLCSSAVKLLFVLPCKRIVY